MATLTLLYTASDSDLAARIRDDLTNAGHTVRENTGANESPLTVALLSPAALDDAAVKTGINEALDAMQHVLPVLAQSVQLPRVIDHMQPVDCSAGYDRDALLREVAYLTGPNAPRPMKVLTPAQRAANRRAGYYALGLILLIFTVSVVAIATGIVGVPEEEFAGVETQIYLTRNFFIDEALPFTTQEAVNFVATVERAQPSVQPFLIETATGIAAGVEGTYIPRSTADATVFPATLEHVSTVVHDRLMATVTINAATAAAISPTPTTTAPTPTPTTTLAASPTGVEDDG